MSARTVHCAEALGWLREQGELKGCSLVTSLPDSSEIPALTLDGWKAWFVDAAAAVMQACPDDGVTIFYQTDVKNDGTWVDKGYLCGKAAERAGCATLFHKIVCRKPVGTVTFGRPAYSHMLCFAREIRAIMRTWTADVMPDCGDMVWSRAMGVEACRVACRFIQSHTPSTTVVDPFCGKGTVLAVANLLGLDAIGVELSKRRARQARGLQVQLT